ncbi:SDR family oxidoreductase [Alloscardovia criceti]|uniref:SDR family oxidoreductase n=1 Tax=Alloscardovia criceti TaxID=356828 RepID=UPI00036C59BC|nr:SDR family oxidoreductase [Alloscardovia criceti]
MKTWLITGAGSGIGKEIARQAIVDGDQVVVTSRNTEKLQDLASIAPERVLPVQLEITDEESRRQVIQETIERFAGIDVVVNNAGRGLHAPLEDTSPEDMRLIFETNYFGPVALIQEALPYLRHSQSAVIVNVSSMGVHFDHSMGTALYVASKAALDATSKVLRNEVEKFHIQVMLVEPGAFRTNFRVAGIPSRSSRSAQYEESYASADYLKQHPFSQSGDPVKAGRLIVQAVRQDTVPKILVLGKGMADVEIESLTARMREVEAVRSLAEQADFDDNDKETL